MKRIRYTRHDQYKGRKLPPNAKKIDRSTKYGNPFPVETYGRDQAIELYKVYLDWMTRKKLLDLTPLIGKDLACSCKLDEACHGDILLDHLLAHYDQPLINL